MEVAPMSAAAIIFTFPILLFRPLGSIPAAAGTLDDDRAALLSFKSGVSSDPNGALASWGAPHDDDVCNWTGVACDTATRRVVNLALSKQKLSGEVSPALANLSHLSVLNLSGNLLTGRVPPELGCLSRLTVIAMSMNAFTGRLPPELGNLSRLNSLDFSGNNLEGPIPVELTRIRTMVYFNLGENNFSGHIPEAIFCNFSTTTLQYLDLSSNSLDGEIPFRGDCSLPELTFLVLWSNYLVGGIPPAISNSTKLRWLLLESNFLTGELPSNMFGGMLRLELVYFSFNSLESPRNNTDLEPFFASLTNCTELKELGLASNEIAGTIPPVIGRLSLGLQKLYLEHNNIFGPMPANLSDLANLTTLNLSHNLLNGSIPPGVAAMQRLERLYLSNNMLSGEIPPGVAAMRRLKRLYLSDNMLSGL